MPVSVGDRLGPYEILEPIGAGGMGEVWKARDTRLDRIVAIKRSKAEFSDRFAREAKAIAALNHPNICQLYDVGPDYLVMEYVEGSPLRGPLPVSKAVAYAGQILSALDAAHRRGITHRDLKPGNILVTNQHGIKLLDFGLARLTSGAGDTTLTQAGQRLGTPAYMAPEQWDGKPGDARSDIYSFGCVLYEMLMGKRAVQGNLATLETAALDSVVRTCMAESPDDRWQSASDVWRGMNLPAAPATKSSKRWVWGAVVGALLLIAAGLLAVRRSTHQPGITDAIGFAISAPENATFSSNPATLTLNAPHFAISPDGRAIVFVAGAAGRRSVLWRRPMDRDTAESLAGTEGAQDPFWSPDGRWIGFFAEGKLKKVPAAGGAVQVLATDVKEPRGGTWGRDGTILFANGAAAPMQKISSAGGQPIAASELTAGVVAHRYPSFLPDGRHFVYLGLGANGANALYAAGVDGLRGTRIEQMDSSAVYSGAGYLLFSDGRSLFAQAFDPAHLRTIGERFMVADGAGRASTYKSVVSASLSGAIAFAETLSPKGSLTWFDRSGKTLGSVGPLGHYTDFRLSPTDDALAASRLDDKTGVIEVWVTDLSRGSTNRIARTGAIVNGTPIFSPDGTTIVFRANQGTVMLYRKPVSGGGVERVLVPYAILHEAGISSGMVIASDWSPDGKNIALSVNDSVSGTDVWLLPVAGDRPPSKMLASLADEMHANFSPDGKLIAYTSNESGKFEVYVQTIPPSEKKWQVSTNGGYEPRWRADGREIYYLSEDRKLMAVAAAPGPSFGLPKPLFQTRVPATVMANHTHYVPSRDGQRFLVNTESGDAAVPRINIILNWTAAINR
jgi:Tol biopolymer transport system component/predicted Ser/Thr protein kinase